MKNRRERRRIIKRLISGVSALALSVGLLASIPASADDSTVGYKYTLFAYSSEEGAITSSAANFCVNGNIATNGTISAGQNFNVNGEKKEHVKEAMPDLTKAINEKFFAENVDVKAENYKNEDVNINVASPLDVKGKAELKGNIKLAAAVKAMGDIVLSGGVLNNDNTVLFSENGSIYINSENVSLTGLVYAPKGNIVIDSKCLNLNSVVIIANKITLNSPNININSNTEMAKFVQESIDKNGGSNGNEEPETDKDPVIYAYGEYNEETKSVDIEWYSNVTGEFAVLESMNGTDYTVVSKISDDTKYSYKVTSDFIKKNFKVATIKGNETFESIPFSIVNANGKYSTELLDTDKDGLADLYEEMLGTDKTVHDTDKDGLTDYEEVYITGTDPTKYDSVTEGVSDADADNDKDGLTNKREIELKTDPNSDDTDGDTLKDGDELSKYNTDPAKRDTDGDELDDDDELKFGFDPNKQDTDGNGIIDSKEKNKQTIDVVPDNKEQAVTKVSVSMAASGNIEKTTTVESIMGKDVLCSNVVGLVGEPFSIESKSSFDKATITFTVDKTKLGETEFDNLMFLWYDEDNDRFVELETYHDVDSSTVSTTTTHFSKYMIVDSYAWFKNWRTILSEQNKKYIENFKPCVTAICVDCSGSMSYNDPVYDTTNKTKRYDAINSFQQAMLWKDYVSIITYESKTKEVSYFSDYFHLISSEELKKSIYSSGGTYVGPALNKAMSQFDSFNQTNPDMEIEKYILLLSDGEFSLQDRILDEVKNKGIVINAVALGKYADKNMLKHCADKTGGEFYEAMTSDDLTDIYRKISKFTHKTSTSNTVSFEDKDIDGLPDEFEKTGFVLSNGTVITTDPTKPDTDGDGLPDGQEIDPIPCIFNFNPKSLSDLLKPKTGSFDLNSSHQDTDISGYYFNMRSNPTKKDSDGDDLLDPNDPAPLSIKNYSSNIIELNNVEFQEEVALLQECLEYLGYLNMGENDYGRFGGLTNAATQLYQINHRLYSRGNSIDTKTIKIMKLQYDFCKVDETTYYAVIKDAVIKGLKPKYGAEIINRVDSILDKSFTPKSIPPEEINVSRNTNNPIVIKPVKRNRKPTEIDKEDIYIYDLTVPLEGLLRLGAQEFHFHYCSCNVASSYLEQQSGFQFFKYDNSSNICRVNNNNYIWLISQVANGKRYDIKVPECWNAFFKDLNLYVPFYQSSFPFMFRGKEKNAEMFGNILYGFSAHAGGFSKFELVAGGAIYSLISDYRLESPKDSENIKEGYEMYNDVEKDYDYIHIRG